MSQTVESSTSSLAAPRELLEAVLSRVRDGIVVVDASGRRVFANDEAGVLTGYASAEELIAAPVDEARARFELFDEGGAPLDPQRLPGRRALAGERPGTLLVRFRRRPNGAEHVSEVTAHPVYDDTGALQYVISFLRDVTAERRASDENEALYQDARRTSALLDALYGSAPVGLGFWDRELRYVRVNEALAEINELAPEAHVGKTFAEVVPQLAHVLEPIARGVLERREAVVALEVAAGTPSHPDDERYWLASYYPVLAPDGDAIGVGCVVEEVTDRRRAEQRTELQNAVTYVLGTSETVDDAVPRVLEAMLDTLGWDVACFWSVDPDAPRVMRSGSELSLAGFLAMTERSTLSPELLPGRVAGARQTEWLEDLEPGSFARAAVATAEGLRSGVAFPVLIGHELAGVLETFSSVRRTRDPDLERTFEAIGAQLGQFIRRKRAEDERVQLLQRERQARSDAEAAAATLRKLERVSEAALEHLSLSDLLNALLQRIVEVLEADTSVILLVGDDGMLHARATVGLEEELERAIPVPVGAGIAGRVAATRSPLLISDLRDYEPVSPVLSERGINSLVAIPLIVEDRLIGVLHAGSVAFAQFVEEDARLLELIADRIALAINQSSLYEAERAAQARLQFLGEASGLLGSSLDVDRTLEQLADLIATQLADWSAIHLVQADAPARLVAVANRDAAKAAAARVEAAALPRDREPPLAVLRVLLSGRSERWTPGDEVTPGSLEHEEGFHSGLIVPLVARTRILGALTLVRAETSEPYDDDDLEFAEDIARRAAIAIDNAQLYREAAFGRDRLGFLAEASALLGSSLDVDETLERLSGLVAGRVADWCAVHLATDSEQPRLVSIAHPDPEKAAWAREAVAGSGPAPDALVGVGNVIRTGEPELWPEIPADLLEGAPLEAGIHSCMIVPLAARDRTFGALSLVWAETDASYDQRDLEFALDLARRAAVAVDNAHLYRAAEERAQAARVLASVGDGVFLVDRHGYVRTWNRAAVAATGLREAEVVDRLATEVIPGWGAIAARIPIVTAGAGLSRAESLPLDLGGRELWLSLHGVAVPDGVVYAFRDLTEERALETMRTEFVSTVSHELRTPLAAIYGAAMTLRRGDVVLDDDQRAILLDVVSGEADRLARTVNDILWASRLDTDSLHVTIQDCDPVALAEDVVKAQRAHLGRGHELVLATEEELPHVAGDPDKVGRVLINLVDNGVKYSPDGGRVAVGVRAVGSHVRFSVRDEGIGIPPGEQRRIFEKFYRLDPNMTRGVGGTGLGLYICRELVRRMEGRIWVESDGLGHGSTFNVELPVAQRRP